MKRILFSLIAGLIAISAHAQTPFIRNDSAATTIIGADGEVGKAAVTNKGELFVATGTAASSIGKAEDAAVSSGDTGVAALTWRQSTPTPSSGADGDYASIVSSGDGTLWVTVTPSRGGGWTTSLKNALSTTVSSVKASAGLLGGFYCYNPAAAVTYVQIFNVATGSVTLGTTTPALSFGIPAGGGGVHEFVNGLGGFSTAISVAATTTATGSSAPATAIDCNFFYK